MADRRIPFELVQRGKQIYKQGGVRHVRILGPVFYADVESEGVYRVTITKNNGGSIAHSTCDCIEGKQRVMCEHVAALDYYLSHKKNEIDNFKELIDYVNKRYSRFGFNRALIDESSRVLRSYYEPESDLNEFFKFVASYYEFNRMIESNVKERIENVIFEMFHHFGRHRTDEFIEVSYSFYVDSLAIRNALLRVYEMYAGEVHLQGIVDVLNNARLVDKLPLLNFLLQFPKADPKTVLALLKDYDEMGVYQLYLADYKAKQGNVDEAMDALLKVSTRGLNRDQERLLHHLQISLSKVSGKGDSYLSYLMESINRRAVSDLEGQLLEAKQLYPDAYKEYRIELYSLIEKNEGSRFLAGVLNKVGDAEYICDWMYGHLNTNMFNLVKRTLFDYDRMVFMTLLMECLLSEHNQRRSFYGVHSFKHVMHGLLELGYKNEDLFELCERLMELSNPEFDLYNYCKEMEDELINEFLYF